MKNNQKELFENIYYQCCLWLAFDKKYASIYFFMRDIFRLAAMGKP